eukprot:4004570-Amphidinium_carterae.2
MFCTWYHLPKVPVGNAVQTLMAIHNASVGSSYVAGFHDVAQHPPFSYPLKCLRLTIWVLTGTCAMYSLPCECTHLCCPAVGLRQRCHKWLYFKSTSLLVTAISILILAASHCDE